MENKTGFFKSVISSVSKPDFAVEIIEKRNGVAYLAQLSLIISLILTLALAFSIYVAGSGKEIINGMKSEIPDFELKNGLLHIDIDEPLIIDGDSSLMIIDSGYDESIMDNYASYAGQKIYINQYSITNYQGLQETTINFSDYPDFYLTKDGFINLFGVFMALIPVFYFVGKFIGLFITGLFMALIVSVIGLIIDSALHTKLSFQKLYTLSLFSLTGLYLLEGVMNFLHKTVFYFMPANIHFVWSYAIMVVFLCLYMNAIKKHRQIGQDNVGAIIPEINDSQGNGAN